jgi:hypothetical protein
MGKIQWDQVKKEIEDKYPPKVVHLVSFEIMSKFCINNGIVGAANDLEEAIKQCCKEDEVNEPLAVARPKSGLFVVITSHSTVWIIAQGVYSWQEKTPLSNQKYYYCQVKDFYSFVNRW